MPGLMVWHALPIPHLSGADVNTDHTGWNPWSHAALAAAILGILLARVPLLWTTGEFIAEDGRVFFAHAWSYALPGSLLIPYAGYFHVLPRLIAEGAQFFPIAWQPLIYALTGLTLNAAILSMFYLPHFRGVLAADSWRLSLCLLLALAPNAENLGLILGLHWYLAFALALLLVMEFPRTAWGRRLMLIVAILIPWSAPGALALAPVFLLKLLRQRHLPTRIWTGLGLANLGLVGAFVLWFRLSQPERTGEYAWTDILPALDRVFLRGWLAQTTLGPLAAQALAQAAPFALSLFGLVMLTILACRFRKPGTCAPTRAAALILASATLMLLLSLTRTLYLAEFAELALPRHTRYLTAPTLLLILAGGILLYPVRMRLQSLTPGFLLGALAVMQIASAHRHNHWSRPPGHFTLRSYVGKIEDFRAHYEATGTPASLYVPSDIPYDGPVLQLGGGRVVTQDEGLRYAVEAIPRENGSWDSWLGVFESETDTPFIRHQLWGELEFLGKFEGRIWFRDRENRLHFTSELLYPQRWITDGQQFILTH